jgi:hypothetical protein
VSVVTGGHTHERHEQHASHRARSGRSVAQRANEEENRRSGRYHPENPFPFNSRSLRAGLSAAWIDAHDVAHAVHMSDPFVLDAYRVTRGSNRVRTTSEPARPHLTSHSRHAEGSGARSASVPRGPRSGRRRAASPYGIATYTQRAIARRPSRSRLENHNVTTGLR